MANDSLTAFIADIIRMDMGTMTRDEIRAKFKAGDYPGLSAEMARKQMEW